MKRVFLYIISVSIISIILVGSVNASDKFSDISTHWAEKQIDYLSDKGILDGYEDGTFRSDGIVTRAEFIKMMTEMFELTDLAELNYSDVSDSDWFYPYISKAAAQGFLLDYGDVINPNGQLAREEAASLLVRYIGLTDMVDTLYYQDYNQISSQFASDVLKATKASLFGGYEDETFRPQNILTRAEALTILYRAYLSVYPYGDFQNYIKENAVVTIYETYDAVSWMISIPDKSPPAAFEPITIAQDFYLELNRTDDGEYEITEISGGIIYTDNFQITSNGFGFSYSAWRTFNVNFNEDLVWNGVSENYGEPVENPEEAIKYLNEVMKVYVNGIRMTLSQMKRSQGNNHTDYRIVFDEEISLDTLESISITLGNP